MNKAVMVTKQLNNMKEFGLQDIISFGKYKGHTISYIAEMDYSYIDWAVGNVKDFRINQDVKDKCLENWSKTYNNRSVKKSKSTQIKSIDGGYTLSEYDFDLGLCRQD